MNPPAMSTIDLIKGLRPISVEFHRDSDGHPTGAASITLLGVPDDIVQLLKLWERTAGGSIK